MKFTDVTTKIPKTLWVYSVTHTTIYDVTPRCAVNTAPTPTKKCGIPFARYHFTTGQK